MIAITGFDTSDKILVNNISKNFKWKIHYHCKPIASSIHNEMANGRQNVAKLDTKSYTHTKKNKSHDKVNFLKKVTTNWAQEPTETHKYIIYSCTNMYNVLYMYLYNIVKSNHVPLHTGTSNEPSICFHLPKDIHN